MHTIHELLEVAIRKRASDLILKAGVAPSLRIDGDLQRTDLPVVSAENARELALEILYSAGRDTLLCHAGARAPAVDGEDADLRMRELEAKQELDVVFTIPSLVRVRANLFMERGAIGAALRIIPLHPYTIEELGLPSILKKIALEPQGLIIITGPTGSGKTTTLAALIEEINRSRNANIFTIEDPIEYLFVDQQSVVHQREIGLDTRSFESALHSVMRQSPDVIAIGELRDKETMDVAMTAAEIGHLVLTTLHTTSAAATVDRIVNSFPEHLKRQVCQQLASSLLCVTSQRLIYRTNGPGRLPAVEVMTASPTIKKQLEEGETGDLYTCIRDGGHFGMNTMNQALEKLYQSQAITYEQALRNAGNQAELRQMLRRT
ncbi:MAG TPA: PilT/PilU family type 4a pilus ATPase [Chthonomonadaceae bacterium]|nr:PilT/PilU family type 4a pilus ATPase [Chthonomonadaceae bacterium]